MSTRAVAGCMLLVAILIFFVLWNFSGDSEAPVAEPAEKIDGEPSVPIADAAPPALQEPARQQAPVLATPSGWIEGIVLDRYGSAAFDAQIALTQLSTDDAEALLASSAVVDAAGEFALDGLAMGMYAVTARSANGAAYAQATLTVDKPSDFVRLILGESGTIQGSVVDGAGTPVADAAVESTHHDGEPVTSIAVRALGTTRTNADGEFVLGPLPASRWQFYVYKTGAGVARTDDVAVGTHDLRIELTPGHSLAGQLVDLDTGEPVTDIVVQVRAKGLSFDKMTAKSDASGHFDVSGLIEGPHVVSLEDEAWSVSQGFQEVAVPLPEGPTIIQCVRTSGIEGSVIESTTGAPVDGVVVSLYPRSAEHRPKTSHPTGPDGQFSLAGLPPLTHIVYVSHPGDLAPMSGAPVDTVNLQPGQTQHLALRMPNIVRIAGTVTNTDGEGVPGAVLEYDVVTGRSRGGRVSTVGNGQFAITSVSPGDVITIVASNLTGRSEPREVRVPQSEAERVELVLNERLDGIIGGKVVDVRGAPLRLRVHAMRRTNSTSTTDHWSVDSAPDGVFLLGGLPPGIYDIGLGESSGWNRIEGNIAAVQLLPGQELLGMRLVYDASQMNTIEGHVVDPEGRGVAGATVNVRDGMFPPSIPTDDQGAFTLIWLEPDVQYSLVAWHSTYEYTDRVSAAPGDDNVTLVVTPKPVVAGRVVSSDNGAPVVRFGIAGGRERYTWTHIEHPDGEFEFAIGSGDDELLVRAENYLEGRVTLPPLTSGQRVEDLEVRLEPGSARVTGRVMGAEGPVGQACIEIGQRRPFVGPSECAAVTDAAGIFDVALPSNEPEWITISRPGFATESFVATPSEAEEEFHLHEGGIVTVRSQRGDEDGGQPVVVRSLDRDVYYQDFLGPDGTVYFDHVLPGAYTVAIADDSEPARNQSTTVQVQNGMTTDVEF